MAVVVALTIIAGMVVLVAALTWIAEGCPVPRVHPLVRSGLLGVFLLGLVAVCVAIAAAMNSFLELI